MNIRKAVCLHYRYYAVLIFSSLAGSLLTSTPSNQRMALWVVNFLPIRTDLCRLANPGCLIILECMYNPRAFDVKDQGLPKAETQTKGGMMSRTNEGLGSAPQSIRLANWRLIDQNGDRVMSR